MHLADVGLVGLAVMGQNLSLNLNDHGYTVSVFNRTTQKVDHFLQNEAKGTKIIGTHSIEEFVKSLSRPRKIILMVKAGAPVDQFIEHMLPYLEKGDLIVDGGNSRYNDTTRRVRTLKEQGILYIGSGVSGGEEGARHGPSLMPGGNPEGWPLIKEMFQAIAAKVEDGTPCCDWVGDEGAGHYVKMVHNGIEYGDIQLICEAYHLLRECLGYTPDQLSKVFEKWNQGPLNSYLIEISRDIFAYKDEAGNALVDSILDVAGQKGTGKWTVVDALDLGTPLTLIGEAVFSRFLSSLKEERTVNSHSLKGPSPHYSGNPEDFIAAVEQALYAAKIMSYTQGFMLMRQAALENQWNLNYGAVALMWREGCIIRSRFLQNIKDAYDKNSAMSSLLSDPFFQKAIDQAQTGWREVVAQAAQLGIPTPCLSTALAFYDGYRLKDLPANLLQAQRDYFGAHTYERKDRPRGEFFHTNWTGHGGDVSSTTYNS